MEAPLYPPAVEFIQPSEARVVLSTRTASLGELMSSPAAWGIVLKHAPALATLAAQPKASLYNSSIASAVTWGIVSRQAVAAIDEELGKLPRSEWPTS